MNTSMKSAHSINVILCLLQLRKLKSLYSQLWKFHVSVNKRFNWTICAALTVFFFKTVIDFHWIALRFEFKQFDFIYRKYIFHEIFVILVYLTNFVLSFLYGRMFLISIILVRGSVK